MKTALTVTLDDELVIKLKAIAKEENRKLSNLVEALIYEALDNKKS